MPIDLDHELRSIASALVAEAPAVPTYRHSNVPTRSAPRRHVALVAAVALALAGAGTLYLARAGDDPGAFDDGVRRCLQW